MTRNWACPTSEEWDRYLLDPDWINKAAFFTHLQDCPQCRFYVDRRSGELAELKDAWYKTRSPRVIRLYPLENEISIGAKAELHLAAEGLDEAQSIGSITLTSPDKEVLLRAVRDHRTRDVWLYIVADDIQKYRQAMVRPFGSDREFFPDEKGRINLGQISWPAREQLTAEIKLPKAVFTLSPVTGELVDTGVTQLNSPHGDRIEVTMFGKGRNRRLDIHLLEISGLAEGQTIKIAIRTGEITQILPIGSDLKGETTLENLGESDKLEIYLFH